MYKINLGVIGPGSRRVRPYIERVEADNVEQASAVAEEKALAAYPNSTVIIEEVWLKVK